MINDGFVKYGHNSETFFQENAFFYRGMALRNLLKFIFMYFNTPKMHHLNKAGQLIRSARQAYAAQKMIDKKAQGSNCEQTEVTGWRMVW